MLMNKLMVKIFIFFLVFSILISTSGVAFADDFIIGGFWAPPPGFTNSTQYDYIEDANLNMIMYEHSFLPDEVLDALDLCAARGIQGIPADTNGISMYYRTDAEIDAIVDTYKNNTATYGCHIFDEPGADTFLRYAYIYKRMVDRDPNHIPNVNLYPIYADPAAQLKIEPTTSTAQGEADAGLYLNSNNTRLGQTVKMEEDCNFIDNIKLYIDSASWDLGESLTLTLWDSPSRNTSIGSCTLTSTNSGNHPIFSLKKSVSPGSTYYWELTLNSGGDKSIGWVLFKNANVYSDGQAYVNGQGQPYDFYFQVYKGYEGYEGKDRVVEQTNASNGYFVNSTYSLGQTFKTPADLERRLEYIELYLDNANWSSNETLTLKVYDNASKNHLLSECSMNTSNNGFFPRFYLYADLKPDTTYYYEVTHNGGGDNNVWVCSSTSNVYLDGTAYYNGTAQSYDFYFKCNFSSKYQAYLEAWCDSLGPQYLKYLSYDYYPFLEGSSGVRGDYFLNLEYARDESLKYDIKLRTYLQSFGYTGAYRRPNENEMRYNIFTNLAYGVKELVWFTWFTPNGYEDAIIGLDGQKTDLYTPVQSLCSQVKQLGPTLMNLNSNSVYHSGDLPAGTSGVPTNFFWKPDSQNNNVIVAYFKDSSDRKYIMAVNKSLTSTTTYSFNVNPHPTAITEVSKSTGQEISTNYNSSTGVISASFAPGEGKLYALPTGY